MSYGRDTFWHMGSIISISCDTCDFEHGEANIGRGRFDESTSFVCRACQSFVQTWETSLSRQLREIEEGLPPLGGEPGISQPTAIKKLCCDAHDLLSLNDPAWGEPYDWPCPKCDAPLNITELALWD